MKILPTTFEPIVATKDQLNLLSGGMMDDLSINNTNRIQQLKSENCFHKKTVYDALIILSIVVILKVIGCLSRKSSHSRGKADSRHHVIIGR